jgi:DNA-binding CsgD family transcriptional regulator
LLQVDAITAPIRLTHLWFHGSTATVSRPGASGAHAQHPETATFAIRTKLRDLHHQGQSPPALSPREADVVRLLAGGNSRKAIGRALDISPQTVDTHRRRLMQKLGCRSAAEVVSYAARSGLLV